MNNPIARIVRHARSNFFWSFVFLDSAKRDAIFAAYAFARHTDDIVDDAPSAEEARERLAEWRTDLDACYGGSPQSDITRVLQPIIEKYSIPKVYFNELVSGVEMDLSITRYATFDELQTYCYRVASVVGLICIEIFGYSDPETRNYATNLGVGLQLTNILRDVGEDARRDRIYLPAEDLNRFGCSEEGVLSRQATDDFRAMMRVQCDRARSYYEKAEENLSDVDRKSMFPAETMGRIYYAILEKIEKRNYDVFADRVTVSTLWKMGIAARNWMIR